MRNRGFPQSKEDWAKIRSWVRDETRTRSNKAAEGFASRGEESIAELDRGTDIINRAADVLKEERRFARLASLFLAGSLFLLTFGLSRVGRISNPVDAFVLGGMLFAGVLSIYLFITIRWSSRLRSKMLEKLV
ncbi:MAG TPA: hypothetical protein VJP06_07280 [Thermoplasmata archaeon]|nr:hypothetical protein [Thermoplasmata archaeon]